MRTITQIREARRESLRCLVRAALEAAYRETRNLPAATNLRHLGVDEMVSAVLEHELGIDWNSESDGVGQDKGGQR